MAEGTPFRAIIVGGGPAGLAVAHALRCANIDFVVLEKKEKIVYESGNGIGIWPHTQRVLDQFGCLDALEAVSGKMRTANNRLPDGSLHATLPLFDQIKEMHGYTLLLAERSNFLRVMSESLDPSKFRCGRTVKEIEEDASGVKVHLDDGSIETGDIVVGADGVHSTVRQIMWDHANKTAPGTISKREQSTLVATYKCLFGISKFIDKATAGDMDVIHNSGFSFLTLAHSDFIIWFIFEKLERPLRYPHDTRFTTEDAEAFAAKYMKHPLGDKMTFQDLWDSRTRATLSPIEEGVFAHWHSGRIVLVGDSVHKMTPNLALGANTAIESAAALGNALNTALKDAQGTSNGHLDQAAVAAAFKQYQQNRLARATECKDKTGMNTRIHAWDGWFWKFFVKKVMILFGEKFVLKDTANLILGGVKLDYVPLKNPHSGTIPWLD